MQIKDNLIVQTGWPNYHLHTTYCDGKSTIAESVNEISKRRLRSGGISSHAPLPTPIARPWAMPCGELESYVAEIRTQQSQFPEIELYIGLEVDFVEDLIGPKDVHAQVDYTIGSIHIAGQLDDTPWEVDMSTALFTRGVVELFSGNYPAAVAHYYRQMQKMLQTSPPSIVGHLDKIKIHNREKMLFDETSKWYREQVMETLKLIAATGVILEINTRGIYQKKTSEPYPSAWIIREAHALKIPVVMSSDAHHTSELHHNFAETARLLQQIGYRELMALKNGVWQPVPFDDRGVAWE